jgi:predicted phage tail protein
MFIEEIKPLVGSGGGGGKGGGSQRSPIEAPTSLRSKDYTEVLAVLSEGQISGFTDADPLKCIYFDKTPIRNASGSNNFTEWYIDYRLGSPSQTLIPGFSKTEVETSVGVIVRNDTPVVRTITDPATDAARVTIGVSEFQRIDENSGDINPTSVTFAIQVSANGGLYFDVIVDTFNGKTSGAYQREYVFGLSGSAPWNIRILRYTGDNDSTAIRDKIVFSSYSAINWTANTYNNTALIGGRFSSEFFSSVPEVAVSLKGIEVSIPHNYNPTTRVYTGAFNGSLSSGYSDNPVWCLWDLLTNERYGMNVPEEQLDVYSFYSIGQYCDQLVNNGLGGTEPRHTLNAYIQNRGGAYEILQGLLSVFQGQIYLANGSLILVQDAPKTSSYIFSPANVITEADDSGRVTKPPFNYETTDVNTRYNSVLVSWDDPNEFYETKTELVEDSENIETYGYTPTEVTAFGCTSRGQAHRLGRWVLYTSLYQIESVTFDVGKDGLYLSPSDIITIQDPNRTTSRLAGRLSAVTDTTVTLDAEIPFLSTKSYTLVLMNDSRELIEREFSFESDTTTDEITVDSFGTDIPTANSYWVLKINNEQEGRNYRILSIKEVGGSDTYQISAIEHSNEKYDWIEDFNLADLDFSLSNNLGIPKAPTGLVINESLYSSTTSSGVKVKVDVIWAGTISAGFRRYEVGWKLATSAEWNTFVTTNTNYTFLDFQPGVYDFRVRTVNVTETSSDYAQAQKEIYGLTLPPGDITNLLITKESSEFARLSWDTVADLDVQIGGKIVIKYATLESDASWVNGIVLDEVSGESSSYLTPLLNGVYMLKAEDSSGHKSENASLIYTTYADFASFNVVTQLEESSNNFPGTKTSLFVDDNDFLRLENLDSIDYFEGDWDDLGDGTTDFDDLNQGGLVTPSGTYEFSQTVDLGSIYPTRVYLVINAQIVDENNLWDSFQGNFDDLQGFIDGGDIEGATVTPQISISQDNVNFSDWQNFTYGDYTARSFKFRLLYLSTETSKNIYVDSLRVVIDMPDREVVGETTTSDTLDTSVLFDNPFYETPKLFFTLQDGEEADKIIIVSESTMGFTFKVENSGSRVIRNINYQAKGFGKLNT